MLNEKKEAPKPRGDRTNPKTDVHDDFMALLSAHNNEEINELVKED